ncbi:unnamed protein product, partial [Discosporangium mesarthrocarpum]
STKSGAQHTAVSLMGLAVGVWFARTVNAHPARVWAFYWALTAVHLLANYVAVRTLALRSLNPSRADLLTRTYIDKVRRRGEAG